MVNPRAAHAFAWPLERLGRFRLPESPAKRSICSGLMQDAHFPGDVMSIGNRVGLWGSLSARTWQQEGWGGMTGAGDLETLYAASYRRLVVQVYAICGDLADAEDAVQEAFVAALRKGRELDGVANTDAWLRRVALNRLRAGWRHASVVRRYQAAVPGPQGPVEVGPEHVAIVTALAQLDPNQRRVMVLHHLADLGTAQIADELGIPEGTVKSRLGRARGRMAELLAEEEARHA